MQELLSQITVYVWGVWRFRWVALASAWVLAILGWVLVWQMPASYVATARIYVDTNTVLGPLLTGMAVQPNVNQRIRLMSQTLLSRPNLERLMRMSDLDITVKNDLEKEEALNILRENIELQGVRGNDSLYSISYENRDRDSARRIVQAMMTLFIQDSLGDKREDTKGAAEFLDERLADYQRRLEEAEERLSDFKQRNVGALPGETGGYYERLNQSQSQLSEARLLLEEMVKRRDEVRRQLAGEEPTFLQGGGGTQETFTALDLRIQSLNEQKDMLLSKYTEKHPAVVQMNLLLEQLEAEREEELKARLAENSFSYAGLGESPVYQGMRSMLAEAEATVAEREVRVAEYEVRVKDLSEKVNNIPLIERELKQLNRDYEVVLENYNSLLERRESARMSENIERNEDDVNFRVIDPPFVPSTPSKPNKLGLNIAVLFAAFGGGIGIALLLSLMRPVILDQNTLSEVSGLPYLGAVSIIEPPSARRRRIIGAMGFSACCVCLLLLFSGVLLAPQLAKLI